MQTKDPQLFFIITMKKYSMALATELFFGRSIDKKESRL
jgi:hypothetical protein